ncbi:hypothetical protein [Absidia glauca]|uniref:Uncharacterized protein n=1 Tax=Absidia glauca TaxID=4829 RepID=A0A168SK20_ABSGL|nr:hypothetical protein [Absidia glauca]
MSARPLYPFLSSEIIACEIPQLVDMIILEQKELLDTFWQYLDRSGSTHNNDDKTDNDDDDKKKVDPGLESLLASYFAKTITIFLTKQPAEMLEFIQSKPQNLNKILNHLHSSAIMDLLLTLVRMEELPEGKGTVQWLSDGGLMDNLVNRLDPYLDTEEHSIAQQCICEIIRMSQTSLLEQPSIGLNDLVIKLKSDTVMRKLAGFMLDPNAPNATSTLINGVTIIIDLIRHNNSDMENDPMLNSGYGYTGNMAPVRQISVSLADMLKVLADNVESFNRLLTEPRSVKGPMKTSIGEQMPLGFERLKICELFAELLHCSNMSNLNAGDDNQETETTQQSDQQEQLEKSHEGHVNETIGDRESAQQGPEPTKDLSTAATVSSPTSAGSSSTTDPSINSTPTATIDKPQETAATNVQPDQQDLPMGDYLKLQLVQHKVLPTCTQIKDDVDLDIWYQYCENELRETKERDCLPLGGDRPNEDDNPMRDDDDDEEDELDGGTASQASFEQHY